MCLSDATTRLCEFWTCGNFNSASIWLIGIRRQDFFYKCHGKWDAYWIGMDLGWFGCVCCPAAWELLRAGSTCPCQNVHRDIIPCNSLLRQKGVEKSCWLESWIQCMAFHNAVWPISMVKIQELFPSCTGMAKATIWQTEWAVMAVNYVQSHWSFMLNHIITKSALRLQTSPTDIAGAVGNVRKRCNNSTLPFWTCGNFKICFHLTHCNSKARFFFNGHVKWDASGFGWIWDDLGVCVCVAPQRESCYELVAPAHVRMCIVTSSPAIPCSGKKVLRKVVDWKVEYYAWHSTMRYD